SNSVMPTSSAASTTARVASLSSRRPMLLQPTPTLEMVSPDSPSWRYVMSPMPPPYETAGYAPWAGFLVATFRVVTLLGAWALVAAFFAAFVASAVVAPAFLAGAFLAGAFLAGAFLSGALLAAACLA